MRDKVAIITGATSGIGRATARLFVERGAKVYAVGRNDAELANLSSEFESDSIATGHAELTDTIQIDRIIDDCIQRFGSLGILVNSAGVIKNGSIETTSLDDWDLMLDVNLRSIFYLISRCVPHLEKTKGNVVNVSSVAGPRAFPNLLAYCVSKAALDQLTRCCALELAPKAIRVNAVNPGVVVTNLHRRGGMEDQRYADFLEHSKATHPLGRVGQPEEVAELICFLASETAGWITGATYEIDGGRGQTCAR